MAIRAELTPNPQARKFTVGESVGGPATYRPGDEGNPVAEALLALDGIASVFMVSDFVTVTKTPEGDWDEIEPAALAILQEHFSSA